MNCDQAFDDLTNPLLLDRDELEQHLRQCARCRQMQETLAPALSWMTDSPADWPHRTDKSSDSGPLLTLQALQVAERCALELKTRRPLPASTWLRRGLMLTAAAFCGFALGVWGIEQREPPAAVSLPQEAGLLKVCLWTQPSREAAAPDRSARHIVASCILCHVPSTPAEARFKAHLLQEHEHSCLCDQRIHAYLCAQSLHACQCRKNGMRSSESISAMVWAGAYRRSSGSIT